MAAIVAGFAAARILDGRARRMWMFVATGVMGAALGDAIWAYYHIVLGRGVPYPGPADLLFAVEYVMLGFVLGDLIRRHRPKGHLFYSVSEALIATVGVGLVAWLVVLRPGLRATGLTPSALMDAGYVALDLLVLLCPALLGLLLLVRTNDRKVVAQWGVLLAGVVLVGVADLMWFWENAHGGWQPGSLVDFAYMAAHVLIAVAALTARDESRAATAYAKD